MNETEANHHPPLHNEVESFIDGHLQAAIGELRAASIVAATYYDAETANPISNALAGLSSEYAKFLSRVSTRNINSRLAELD